MCGICGIINHNGLPVNPKLLTRMRDCLIHRGTNDKGAVLLGSGSKDHDIEHVEFAEVDELTSMSYEASAYNIGLAHRRLSIIDLSDAGCQPMRNEDGAVWLTFDGEIYNYLDIRKSLQKAGHQFKSNTDAEIVIHAYEEWGETCVNNFNGMFVFAIYDCRKKDNPLLFLARDRVGKKPLYYLQNRDEFYFASELKGIKCAANRSFETDHEALNFYFALGYVPGAMCILKGVRKLPPAHAALYDIKEGKLVTWKYWEVPYPEEDNDKYTEDELVDELEYLLEDSVRLRMISDVPLGIFLSGGVDSSLVTAMAARCSSTPVKTFTITFPNTGQYDEAAYARIVAEHFKTDHHTLSGTENVFDIIKDISSFVDEPIGDSSLLPTYLISKLARQYVTVALGGDGGDELFGGYNHYKQAKRDKERLKYVPVPFLKSISKIAVKLPAGLKGRNRLYSLKGGYLERSIWSTPYFDLNLRKKLFSKELLIELGSNMDAPEKWKLSLLSKGCDDIDKLTRCDFSSYLPEDIMTKVDRASMACSLEVRAPWLDYRIVEFAFKKVAPECKVNKTETRILEKRLGERLLPKELNLNRKQGFSVPMDDWLRGDEGRKWAKSVLELDTERFNRSFIKELAVGQMRDRSNGARLWSLGLMSLAEKGLIKYET